MLNLKKNLKKIPAGQQCSYVHSSNTPDSYSYQQITHRQNWDGKHEHSILNV